MELELIRKRKIAGVDYKKYSYKSFKVMVSKEEGFMSIECEDSKKLVSIVCVNNNEPTIYTNQNVISTKQEMTEYIELLKDAEDLRDYVSRNRNSL